MAPKRTEHRYEVDPVSGCWLWLLATNAGYGIEMTAGRKVTRAHRNSYEKHVGKIPDGYDLHHLCGVRRCINPAHLMPVTKQQHIRTDRCILTVVQVREIRRKYHEEGARLTDLQQQYGMSVSGLRNVVDGSNWRDVC